MERRRGNHEGSLRRRGGTWEGAIVLSGRRYYVYAPSRAECPQKLLTLLERHRRGQLSPPPEAHPPGLGPAVAGGVSNVMRELCQKAGVLRRPAHYLRHCHATLLAALGLEIKTLRRRLGHSRASLTLDVYAHALGEMDRKAAEMVASPVGVKVTVRSSPGRSSTSTPRALMVKV
jgi:integrase